MKTGRAVGPDKMHGELVKLLLKDNSSIKFLAHFFDLILHSDAIPEDWFKSIFIALPKKNNATDCSDYRTISLMSHVLKILLKIIHRRISQKCEENSGSQQFGFRSGFGTREALCAINVLAQRCRDVNRNLYLCFIDYKKAFEC